MWDLRTYPKAPSAMHAFMNCSSGWIVRNTILAEERGLAQPTGGIDSVQNRHSNVGHNDVGTKAEGLRRYGGTIRCGSHYVKLRLQKRSCGFK